MLFLSAVTDASVGFKVSESLLLSLVGFAIVFAVLIVLIIVIRLITALSAKLDRPAQPALAAAAAAPAASVAVSAAPSNAGKVPAPGSIGECDLHTVDDKTAAMLMAIVADNLNAPLNELRFLSIKELGEGK